MSQNSTKSSEAWSFDEVESAVASYLQMLKLELAGQSYKKSEFRALLLPKLNNRTEGSIEFKHQNISAVLNELKAPWIFGYKPSSNYQGLLFDVVAAHWMRDPQLDNVAISSLEHPAILPTIPDYSDILVPCPKIRHVAKSPESPYQRKEIGLNRDYQRIEANNSSLGSAGEEFVVAFERYRLIQSGVSNLADRVEHVSKTRGDGLGYDVLSFNVTGKERLIEVKTTSLGLEAPFYITKTELNLSKSEPDLFKLCRLFDFRRKPKLFELAGSVSDHCLLDPVSFIAKFT
jgi:Domain of unknown function (DUF3883)